jgi:hypothetical protein
MAARRVAGLNASRLFKLQFATRQKLAFMFRNQLWQRTCNSFHLRSGEVLVPIIPDLELAAVDCDARVPEQIESPTHHDKARAGPNWLEGVTPLAREATLRAQERAAAGISPRNPLGAISLSCVTIAVANSEAAQRHRAGGALRMHESQTPQEAPSEPCIQAREGCVQSIRTTEPTGTLTGAPESHSALFRLANGVIRFERYQPTSFPLRFDNMPQRTAGPESRP